MRARAWPLVLAAALWPTLDVAAEAAPATTPSLDMASAIVQQQRGVVRGRVTSDTGQPLELVQVSIVGTSMSTASGANGEFLIANVPAGLYTVRAQRIGFADATQENVRVTGDGTVTVNFTMRVSALTLDEVVVTGVADPTSARRVPFTVGRVSGEALQVPQTNAVSSLQGKVAGVSAISPAQPGAGINIVMRTPTSINRGNTPLIVVDGVILASTFGRSTTDLSAMDIESIEVVKGAAAASMYGSRASAGVVQIRTRRGTGLEVGRTQFTVRSEFGNNTLARRIALASHHQYLTNAQGQYINSIGEVVDRSGRIPRPESERFLDVPYRDPTFDHGTQFFDPGNFMNTTVTMARNADDTNFFASFGRQQVDGVVLNHDGYGRNDVRLNLDHRLNTNLQFSFSGFHMRSDRHELPSETFFQLIQHAPDVNLLAPDADGTPYMQLPDPDEGVTPNPLYQLYHATDDEQRARTLASADLRWAPLGWVSFDGNFSYDRSDRLTRFYWPRGAKTNVASWQQGVVSRGQGITTALNSSLSAQLRGSWDELTGRLTLRALQESEDYEFFSSRANNLTVEGVPDLDAGTIPVVGGSTQEIRAQGYFAIGNLDWRGRYIMDALVRRDGSSLFGPEERWHTYYRGSAAWRMAEEPWWPVADLTEFKLRASIGTAGGRPSFADRFETYAFSDGGTLTKSTLGNRFLKPERAREIEYGVDAIFRDIVSVQISHARTRTTDQLIAIPLPAGFGFSSQWQNAGTVEGRTWEATIEATLMQRPGLLWSMGLVADRSSHEITEFNRRCFRTGTASAFFRCAGEQLGTMYGTRFLQSVDELPAGLPASEFQVNDDGLVVWVGAGGDFRNHQWGTTASIDGTTYRWGMPILQVDDEGSSAVVRIGDSNPDLNWGLSSNVTWRGLTLYGLLNAQVGGDIYNRTNQRMYQYFRSGDTDQAGRPDDLKKTTEYYSTLYASNLINQWFIEDASHVKLRELSLRYRIPQTMLDRVSAIGLDNLTLFAIGRNLYTWTDYKGYDPEAGTPLQRIDDFVYPQYRTLTAGFEVRF
ncbi:MAG TPA: SusC/RagA family TonB-linked outer membrane protein [Longimicrobiales bacterium]|nr:SusC/RagA family TonB-linked outer membrane protein [Longimicrobiales bacterium]